MSFDNDVECVAREATRRGGHSDYSYRKMSRRYSAVGILGPTLVDTGADVAIVVELPVDAG